MLAAGRKIIPPLPIGLPKPLCIPPLPIYSQPPAKEPGRKILGEKRPRPLAGKAKLLHEARLERERKEAETRMKKKPGPKPMISRSVFDDVSAAKRKVKKRSLKGLSACPCVDNPIAGFKVCPASSCSNFRCSVSRQCHCVLQDMCHPERSRQSILRCMLPGLLCMVPLLHPPICLFHFGCTKGLQCSVHRQYFYMCHKHT